MKHYDFSSCPPRASKSLCPSVSLSELEELQQALKWTQHCLADAQSQQDVELLLQLVAAEDFRNAYTIYAAVSQQKSAVSPTSPLTVQAEDLCQEVGTVRSSVSQSPFDKVSAVCSPVSF